MTSFPKIISVYRITPCLSRLRAVDKCSPSYRGKHNLGFTYRNFSSMKFAVVVVGFCFVKINRMFKKFCPGKFLEEVILGGVYD